MATSDVTSLSISLSDFPVYDGKESPEEFLKQCRRISQLGNFSEDKLSSIIAARCRGLALQLVQSNDAGVDVAELLTSSFSSQRRPETAAAQLSVLKRGSLSVVEYALQVRSLVRQACPEFFDGSGSIKKICVPSHEAALYRHFLIGLDPEERRLLSRQRAGTFEEAVAELSREEAFTRLDQADSVMEKSCMEVHWADLTQDTSTPPREKSREEWPSRGRDSSRSRQEGRRGQSQSRSPYRSWRSRHNSSSSDRSEDGGTAEPRRMGPGWTHRRDSRRPASPRPPRRSSEWRQSSRREYSSSPRHTRVQPESSQGRRQVQCWSCRGFGHLKRQCPNGSADRYTR